MVLQSANNPINLRMEIHKPGAVNLTELSQDPKAVKNSAKELHWQIAKETILNRGLKGATKYGIFFGSFWGYGLVSPARARALKSGYFWIRDVDDVADGDKILPDGYDSKPEYLQKRRDVAVGLSEKQNPTYGDFRDILLVDAFMAADKLNITLGEETVGILDTIIFDEERSRTKRVPTKMELDQYFDKLDFTCIDGGLKIAGDTCTKDDTYDISMAVRTMFNLRDLPEDLSAGIINIPSEDITDYKINLELAFNAPSISHLIKQEGLRNWFCDQMALCQMHLDRSDEKLGKLKLKPQTRFALSFNSKRLVAAKLKEFEKIVNN